MTHPHKKPLHSISKRSHATSPFFTAKQLASIYKFPQPNNKPVTVAVLSFGGGIYGNIDSNGFLTKGDVHKYWSYQNIKTIPKVIVQFFVGATNDISDIGSTTENTLDISVIGSCCPSSNVTIILFVFPNTHSLTNAFQTVVDGISVNGINYKPSIISVSWGAPEIYYVENGIDVTGELDGVNTVLKRATEQGINICVASGDYGATDGNGTNTFSVDFPSSCPYVTSVGGTTLTCPNRVYDNKTKEVVWNDGVRGNFYATGGGISKYFKKPSYQTIGTFRNVPDIALNADPDTGISLYVNNQLQHGVGGTSMSAPMFAGYLACFDYKTFVNPILYKNPNCFYDIVLGSNYDITQPNQQTQSQQQPLQQKATLGYDLCSGLGSINGTKLNTIFGLKSPNLVTSITITPSISTIIKGTTRQYTSVLAPSNATNKKVTWSSSTSSVATIHANGLVVAVNVGTTIIKCTVNDSRKSYSFPLSVIIPAVRNRFKLIF